VSRGEELSSQKRMTESHYIVTSLADAAEHIIALEKRLFESDDIIKHLWQSNERLTKLLEESNNGKTRKL
jgi:hypothetical protein